MIEAEHRPADVRNDLLEREPQARLEEDDAHGDRDERLVQRAQQLIGVHVVGRVPGQESRRQQHDDGGHVQRPRDQLRAHGQDEDERKAEQDLV